MTTLPWGYMPPSMRDQVRRQMDWEQYLGHAKALGYTEREARMVVAGVFQVAKKIPQAIDILAEARDVLAAVEETERRPISDVQQFEVDSAESARLNGMTYP